MLSVKKSKLTNGLRVVVIERPGLHAVSQSLLVNAGPCYENDRNNGLSHMVEHLLFRGTNRFPSSLSYNEQVEDLGAEVNGQTQRDAMTIDLLCPEASWEKSLELLASITTEPKLKGIEVEREVVLEEILDTKDGQHRELDADTLSRQLIWANHPLGMPVLGSKAHVESFTERQCRNFYKKLFVSNNAVLSIAGPVCADDVFEQAEKVFASMPSGAELKKPKIYPLDKNIPIAIQPTADAQVEAVWSFPSPAEKDADFPALFLLKRILDDGLSSRLRQALCEQSGLAYSLGASIDAYADLAALDIELSCSPEKLLTAFQILVRCLRDLKEHGVSEAELERAKKRHLAELSFSLDNPQELSVWFGATELMGVRCEYDGRIDELLAIRTEEIKTLAAKVFDIAYSSLLLIGPKREADLRGLEMLLGRRAKSTLDLRHQWPEPTKPKRRNGTGKSQTRTLRWAV